MSAILTRVEIGAVGALPGRVLMSSHDDLATITSPGYLKPNEGGVSLLPTDIIEAVYGNPMVNKQTFSAVFIGNEITLVAIGGGGSINGATNLPGGDGILGVSGDNITGKSFVAGANISITPGVDTLTIAATGSGGGTITGIADVGIGQGHLAAGTSGANVQVKTLVAGSNLVITENSTTVTIASSATNDGLTNLANLPGGEGIFAGLAGTVGQLKSIAAGPGIDITASGNNVIITNTGGGGGGFSYQNTQWVAKNGNDANDGRSIDTPKLTIQAAITALAGSGAINIEDNGIYTGSLVFGAGNNYVINALGATLNASSGFLLTISGGSTVVLHTRDITRTGEMLSIDSTSNLYIYSQHVLGNITNSGDAYIFVNEYEGSIATSKRLNFVFDLMAGDVTDTSPSDTTATCFISGRLIGGDISSTNNQVSAFVSNVFGNVSGVQSGIIGNVLGTVTNCVGGIISNYAPAQINGQPYNVITWNTAQTNILNGTNFQLYSNAYINYTGNNGYGRFDLTNDAAVPVGFKCWMFQNVNDNQTGVLSSGIGGLATIVSPSTVPGVAYTRRNGSWILLTKVAQNGGVATFNVSGDLWQSNLITNTNNVYVSQLSGSDVVGIGTGTIESPYATVQFAVTSVGAPVDPTTIFILDGQTYTETVTVSQPNIYIVGPEALLTQTGGPAALTFTTSGVSHFVNLGGLIGTGGSSALVSTGSSSIVSTGEALVGDVQTNTGEIFIRSVQSTGNYASVGIGHIRYLTTFRNGTDGTNVIGCNPLGASTTWTTGAGITATTGNVQALAGNLEAGSNGNFGRLLAFPSTPNSGFFLFQPNDNTANVSTTFSNQPTSVATTHAFPNLAFSNVTLLATTVAQTDPNSNLIYFDTTVTAAELAGGASISLVSTFFGGQYRVRELYINSQGTNFTGGGGDRNVQIDDGTTVYSIIPAATLQALVNNRWGSTDIPFPAAASINTLTQPGINLNIRYNAGSADYATGSVTISGVWEKVL